MELKGKYGKAKVFTDDLEKGAKDQIINLLDQEFVEGADVRIMPDVHQGKGSVIGFTADLKDKVIPNIVGVDIGCGVLTVELGDKEIDFKKLDNIIKQKVPAGSSVHKGRKTRFEKAEDLTVFRELKNTKRIDRSIGTLGSGNHFIEVGEDSEGKKYMVIHSGSRNLGNQIAKIHQEYAIDLCSGKEEYYERKEKLIEDFKARGKRDDIEGALKKLKREYSGQKPSLPKDLCYLTGKFRENYIHDMKIAQEYASLNRKTMAENILKAMFDKDLEDYSHFETVHNYINFKDNIIRKGAISAYEGENVLIPINMRDGSIIGKGKGNKDWNYSAPHGAGRLLSRTEAKQKLSLDKFKETMKGIYSTSVNKSTLDESPDAYKDIEDILDSMGETVDVIDIIKPVYNFKA
ncbi:MAG: RtcB family protein [Tissierella sp.]|uniref:RtcB family protein n=1 Tax=Tissierella sp. TaxID=41274 RepID=UPI003F970ECF